MNFNEYFSMGMYEFNTLQKYLTNPNYAIYSFKIYNFIKQNLLLPIPVIFLPFNHPLFLPEKGKTFT